MATLTFVFDPYCPRSTAASVAILQFWRTHRSRVRFEAVHAGTATARPGLGPDSERSARAFGALRAAAPHLELPLVHALHEALSVGRERLGRLVTGRMRRPLTAAGIMAMVGALVWYAPLLVVPVLLATVLVTSRPRGPGRR